MSELGECPNNTENTVCLSPSCKYKHDRTWPIPTTIQEAMNRELDVESYVDRMLNTPTKCPCGCGGIFDLPKKKETKS